MRRGIEPRLEAVGVLNQLALRADIHQAAARVHPRVADVFGLGRQQAPVVPRQLDRRQIAALRELVVRRRRRRIRRAVERRRQGLDRRRVAEIERPERMVDEVRAHVAKRALAPIHPAAPVERVIDRVVVDFRRAAEEQVPIEIGWLRIVADERRGEALLDVAAVPAERPFRVVLERRRARNALRPVAERPVGPDVDLAHFTDRAAVNQLVAGAGVVGRVTLVAHLRDDLAILRFLGQDARFLDRPAERLLHVDVLAEIHRQRRDRRVHVIRRSDDDRVDVLLLLEHLAVVTVLRELRQVLVDEAPGVLAAVLRRPAGVGFLLRLRGLRALRAAAAALRGGRGSVRGGLEALDGGRQSRIVHVAEGHEVLTQQCLRVARAHPQANHGDVHRVAGRLDPASEHMAGHDGHRRTGACDRAHELASGDVTHRSALSCRT